eukprot:g44812.t1
MLDNIISEASDEVMLFNSTWPLGIYTVREKILLEGLSEKKTKYCGYWDETVPSIWEVISVTSEFCNLHFIVGAQEALQNSPKILRQHLPNTRPLLNVLDKCSHACADPADGCLEDTTDDNHEEPYCLSPSYNQSHISTRSVIEQTINVVNIQLSHGQGNSLLITTYPPSTPHPPLHLTKQYNKHMPTLNNTSTNIVDIPKLKELQQFKKVADHLLLQ